MLLDNHNTRFLLIQQTAISRDGPTRSI